MKFIRQHSTLYDRNGSFIPTKRNADWLHVAAEDMYEALEELYALVKGECPSLLDEDSGGCARLDMDISLSLAKARGEVE